jgi:DNA-directed RNA polymerase subunit omega
LGPGAERIAITNVDVLKVKVERKVDMAQVPIEDLLKQCPSIYNLVVVAVKRARELALGSPKLVQTNSKKITTVALEEMYQGKVSYKPLDGDAHPGRKHKEKATAKSKK